VRRALRRRRRASPLVPETECCRKDWMDRTLVAKTPNGEGLVVVGAVGGLAGPGAVHTRRSAAGVARRGRRRSRPCADAARDARTAGRKSPERAAPLDRLMNGNGGTRRRCQSGARPTMDPSIRTAHCAFGTIAWAARRTGCAVNDFRHVATRGHRRSDVVSTPQPVGNSFPFITTSPPTKQTNLFTLVDVL
jgi:hypothetical protein